MTRIIFTEYMSTIHTANLATERGPAAGELTLSHQSHYTKPINPQ